MCLRAVDLGVEEASHRGRADMVVRLGGQVFVLGFKMADGEEDGAAALDAAMAQMRERGYAETWRDHNGPVHLIAVACEARNLLDIRAEAA